MAENINIHFSFLELLVCLLLVVATLTAFLQVRNHDFVNFDDNRYVTENHHVLSGLTWEGIIWAFTATHAYNWHPLTWLSHMFDSELFGVRAGGHHLMSLLLHIGNCLLLFLVLKRMTGAPWRSAFVAALFALHPLHVESVAWVSERKDVLSTFFWMLTLWAYVRYAENPRFSRYLWIFMFFALGLMAKPMLVTLPFVLLLLDYWPLGRLDIGQLNEDKASRILKFMDAKYQKSTALRLIWEKLPLFTLSAVSSIVTFLVQQKEGAVQSFASFPLNARLANALVSYISYMGKMIWPTRLAVFYPHPGTVPIWKATGATFFLLCLSVLVIQAARQYPYLATGWLWYLGTLVPVIGLVQVGAHAMADRYTYLPLIGLFVMIVWGVYHLGRKWPYSRIIFTISTTLIFLALIVCTGLQVRHWRNSISLFKHAINVTTENYLAHVNLGIAFFEKGKMDEAIAHYSHALAINSNYARAHNSLGAVLLLQGRFKEAIPHFSRALEIEPNYNDARNNLQITLRRMGQTDDDAEKHNRQAIALAGDGKFDEAISHLSLALRIRPDFAEAHYNMGNVLAGQGKLDEAIHHFFEALRIKPNYAEAHNNLGITLARQGKLDNAMAHFSEALRIKPNFVEAKSNLKRAKEKARKP